MTRLLSWVFMLCRGEPETLRHGMEREVSWLARCLLVIVAGAGLYGATIGLWRAPLQGFYAGVKFPALIMLTTIGNALINGMLAQLLGLPITFRQTFISIVTCFAISSAILGSFSPVMLFLLFNTPPLSSTDALFGHHLLLLAHVGLIAFAGVAGHVRLWRLLLHLSGRRSLAGRILSSWLAINLFLGCQLSWSLRPFVGTPNLPIEFLREDAFRGTFYESIYKVLLQLGG